MLNEESRHRAEKIITQVKGVKMLSEKEETRLQGLAEKVAFCKEDLQYPRLNSYDIEWLVTRLKEINDELKRRKDVR